jgi:hypothetical protein
MKTSHKIVLLAGAVAGAMTIRRELRRIRRDAERDQSLPTLRAVEDAEPAMSEPLESSDIRVAQNSPL